MNENENISIKKLCSLVLNKIWLVIIAAIVGATAAFSYSHFVLPVQYQSHTSMFVKNVTKAVVGPNAGSNYDINNSRSLTSTYVVVLKDDAVMEELSKKLIGAYGTEKLSEYFTLKHDERGGLSIPPNQLLNCIQMDSINETEVIKVTATTTSPQLSADICNMIAEIAPTFLIRVVGAGSVESIGAAEVNRTPVSPNTPKNTCLGFLAGIVLAVAIIFLIDFFDNTVKEYDEISNRFKKPILGEVQFFSSDKKKRKRRKKVSDTSARDTLLNENIPFYIVESYKAMRTNLTFSLSTTDKKIIAVSSPMPGEGKSTTAANLAIAIAQTDKKVLLIDGDLRKPVQHKTFELKNKNGLSSVLGKMKKLDECIQKTSVENLHVMTSGPKPPNPSELLASAQTEKLLNAVSEKYDYIIIDTPPVNIVSDAMGLNNYIAGIILVLKYASTTFDEITESIKNMELSDSNILGFVLNDITKKTSSYGGYKYKDKYGYKSGYGYTSIVSDFDDKSDEDEKNNDPKKSGKE